jgi:hypothetical protein
MATAPIEITVKNDDLSVTVTAETFTIVVKNDDLSVTVNEES